MGLGIGLGLKALLGEILFHYLKGLSETDLDEEFIWTLTFIYVSHAKCMLRQAIRVTERSRNLGRVTDASTGNTGNKGNMGNTGMQERGQRVRGGRSRDMGGGTNIDIVRNKHFFR